MQTMGSDPQVTTLFWFITFILLILACLCIWPGLSNIKQRIMNSLYIVVFAYGLYFYLGQSQHLKYYYSPEFSEIQTKLALIRPMFAELAKKEVRLRLRLIEKPDDLSTQCQLYDTLAIRALQTGDETLALRYRQQAQTLCNTILPTE